MNYKLGFTCKVFVFTNRKIKMLFVHLIFTFIDKRFMELTLTVLSGVLSADDGDRGAGGRHRHGVSVALRQQILGRVEEAIEIFLNIFPKGARQKNVL